MKYKRSAVDLTDLAIGIMILGIVVAIGARILVLYRDNRLTNLAQLTTSNETVAINGTGIDLANTWVSSVDVCYSNVSGSGTQLVNSTIVAGNYSATIDSVSGQATLTNTSASNFNDAACTYTTYDITEPEWTLPDDAASGLAEYGNWFDIIVIVGIAGLILALLFLAFGRRGGDGGQTY